MSNELIPVKVKHTLRDLRVRIGLSQTSAAQQLGITEPNGKMILEFCHLRR